MSEVVVKLTGWYWWCLETAAVQLAVTKTTTKLNHGEKQIQLHAWEHLPWKICVVGLGYRCHSVMHQAPVLTSHWMVFRKLCYNGSREQKFLHVESTINISTWSLRFIGKVNLNYRGTVIRDGIVFPLKLFPLQLSLTIIDVPLCFPWKHLPLFLCFLVSILVSCSHTPVRVSLL